MQIDAIRVEAELFARKPAKAAEFAETLPESAKALTRAE